MIDTSGGAVERLLEVWDEYTVSDLGPHLTCNETNALAEFFRAAGANNLADALIEGHSYGDDPGDEHYRGDA